MGLLLSGLRYVSQRGRVPLAFTTTHVFTNLPVP